MLTSSSSFSASSKVLSGIVHTGDRLYAGTENDGLYILGPEGNNVHCPAGKDGLKSGNIHSVCLDRRGNLWLGTYLGGLYMRPKGRSSFISFRSGSRRAPELTTNNVYSILNDSMGNLWVGTRDGGLYRYDYETGTLVHVAGNLPNNLFIWDIFEDSVGDIWLACYGAHIWKLSSSEGYAAHEVESPVSTYVSICELSDGRIAFCTETDGIICFNPRDNSCAKVTSVSDFPTTLSMPRFRTTTGTCGSRQTPVYAVQTSISVHIRDTRFATDCRPTASITILLRNTMGNSILAVLMVLWRWIRAAR